MTDYRAADIAHGARDRSLGREPIAHGALVDQEHGVGGVPVREAGGGDGLAEHRPGVESVSHG